MKITTETEISVKDYGSGVSTEKKEILFAKTLEQVKNTAKEQGNCISAQQVEEAFGPLALSGEQMDMVYAYLHQRKIGVGEPVDPDEYLAPEEKDYLEHYLETLRALPQVSAGEREAITLSAMAGGRGCTKQADGAVSSGGGGDCEALCRAGRLPRGSDRRGQCGGGSGSHDAGRARTCL